MECTEYVLLRAPYGDIRYGDVARLEWDKFLLCSKYAWGTGYGVLGWVKLSVLFFFFFVGGGFESRSIFVRSTGLILHDKYCIILYTPRRHIG